MSSSGGKGCDRSIDVNDSSDTIAKMPGEISEDRKEQDVREFLVEDLCALSLLKVQRTRRKERGTVWNDYVSFLFGLPMSTWTYRL